MCSNQGRLVTGSVSGFLQLWQVDCSSSPPIVAMVNTMQLDGAIFSAVFDTRIELVSFGASVMHEICTFAAWPFRVL